MHTMNTKTSDVLCRTEVPQQVDLFVQIGCGDTTRWGLCGVTTLSGVSNGSILRVPPRSQDGLEGLQW